MRGWIRRAVPRGHRLAAAAAGRYRGARIRRRLAALAGTGRPILAGPWLGEVGFEILYWAPFVRWFAAEFDLAPERLIVLSRGGTASWYGPAAGRYQDVFDYVSPDVFKRWQQEHLREIGEQKQTRMTTRERELLDSAQLTLGEPAEVLHPASMYGVLNPYWWGHLDARWVHRHTRYERLRAPELPDHLQLPPRYVAAKFYFNDCFPATEENRAFVRDAVGRLAGEGPVVSLSGGVPVDDHGHCSVATPGVMDLGGVITAATNLQIQSAIVAHATAFVGTYGGFAYLAPFYGVPSTSYYGDPGGFARSHLHMAQSAFDSIGAGGLLQVLPTPARGAAWQVR